jgi:hypothetical protein
MEEFLKILKKNVGGESLIFDLAAPQGFEPRYADPELMDHIKENTGFHAENSITCLQLKPARKHFDVVVKRLALVRMESKRMAHLRHIDFTRLNAGNVR